MGGALQASAKQRLADAQTGKPDNEMPRQLSKDTTLCMSLSARPSNFGTRFHNYLYKALGLDYIYKAFTTKDLSAAIGGVRALGIRGCAVSMPFKEACMALVDEIDASASVIESVNTIVNTEGRLKAYNTDYLAVSALLNDGRISPSMPFALRGSGGLRLEEFGFSRWRHRGSKRNRRPSACRKIWVCLAGGAQRAAIGPVDQCHADWYGRCDGG